MDWRSIQAKVIAGLIVAAIVALFGAYWTWVYPQPNVTLKTVGDTRWSPIKFASAPFKVGIKGSVNDTRDKYVYLVVKDPTAEWIQPGLGANVQGEFEGWCYLGIETDPRSMGISYTIFGVVTDRAYSEHEQLDRKTVKAESKHIQVTRTTNPEAQNHIEQSGGIQSSNTKNTGNSSTNAAKTSLSASGEKSLSADNLNNIIKVLLERDWFSFQSKLKRIKKAIQLKMSLKCEDNNRHIFLNELSDDQFNQVERVIKQTQSNGMVLNPVLTLWTSQHYYKKKTTRIEITVCKNPRTVYFSAIYLE